VRLGAWAVEDGVEFCVWAPDHARVDLVVTAPDAACLAMHPTGDGHHERFAPGLRPGARYRFVVGGRALPDPASRWQPDDVHGDSAVVEPAFAWSDPEWVGGGLADYVVYELHVGTFTRAGTLDGAAERLDDLAALGVTAVELMPVAEFPGARNWGYDGVFPYAVESSYGGPDALRRFVDAAHGRGLSVVLDVVYNHLGPEGNVLAAFGPYFTDRYRTPWGDALNFDGPLSDGVRRFFVENAIQWVRDFRVDALRLDAVHAIADTSAYPFVEELTDAVHAFAHAAGRHVWVVAESAANDARLVTPKAQGGVGCDAQWDDDFHHALHALLTGERDEYYVDYGDPADLAVAYREAFVYSGRYSAYRRRRHGRPATGLPGERFVVFAQNHDQVGNRAGGERLASLVDPERLRVAAAAVLLAPFVPLLFMGEEHGETRPFPFFVSHGDAALLEAVRRGRREELAHAVGSREPPDPASEATFRAAVLDWDEGDPALHRWYAELIALRRARPALASLDPASTVVDVTPGALVVTRAAAGDLVVVVLGLDGGDVDLPAGASVVLLDSHGRDELTGAVPPWSVLVLGVEA
jgi:maltooligosyltrehalose trehalohydrolase